VITFDIFGGEKV